MQAVLGALLAVRQVSVGGRVARVGQPEDGLASRAEVLAASGVRVVLDLELVKMRACPAECDLEGLVERGECRRSGAGKSAVDARILDEPGEEVDLQDIVLASTFGFVSRPVTSLTVPA